jgi:MFS family permease
MSFGMSFENRARWIRIIPVATTMYAIAFINRTNVSIALPSMSHSLHMDSFQAGAISGIFFWGYMILQIPGGYLASRWSTKYFVGILLVVWGCCSVGCGLVQTWHQLWVMRLLLGVAEGGMYPATLILLSHWFPGKERARASAWFSIALPISLVVSSPLSGWLLDRWNWRVMLMAEGALPLLWLLIWLLMINDYPGQAKWISRTEREYLEGTFREEIAKREPADPEIYWQSLLSPRVLLLALVKLLMLSGQLGYLFWLPSVIKRANGGTNLSVGLLSTIPFIIGSISLLVNSAHSDKKKERSAHVAIPMFIGGLSLFGAIWTSGSSPVLGFALVCLAAIGAFAPLGPFWAIPTEWFSRKMGGSVAGLVNGIGNLGGFFGPLLVGYLNKRTGSFAYGFGLLAIFLLVGGALSLALAPPKTLEKFERRLVDA